MKSAGTCRQPGPALRGRRAGKVRSPALRSAGISLMRGARLGLGAPNPSRRWPRAAEPGRDVCSAAFLGGDLKVSSLPPLPGPPWGFRGIALRKPCRSGRLSPAWVAAGPGYRIPRLAEGAPAAPSTDTALRGSLKAVWFIFLRALLNGDSERKSPRNFPVPLVSLLA